MHLGWFATTAPLVTSSSWAVVHGLRFGPYTYQVTMPDLNRFGANRQEKPGRYGCVPRDGVASPRFFFPAVATREIEASGFPGVGERGGGRERGHGDPGAFAEGGGHTDDAFRRRASRRQEL
ncbi:hypothetical protein B296_00039676 [Ensete ventricosum]|uniref:Uncharacterized protein n=1 Tax=Ensete ventricosum TaxID=4639 RepID=A0A426XWU5_ENSVE|nr:hypothetical protein B296_00039676 [Ensete ventricosum]